MALAAYRNLLRSTRIAFQDDSRILHAARHSVRENFNAKRSLPPLGDEAKAGIAHAKEVATILRRNIVQGEKFGNEEGRGERYQLRIHPETERGDNATIKSGRNRIIEITGGCCGGGQ